MTAEVKNKSHYVLSHSTHLHSAEVQHLQANAFDHVGSSKYMSDNRSRNSREHSTSISDSSKSVMGDLISMSVSSATISLISDDVEPDHVNFQLNEEGPIDIPAQPDLLNSLWLRNSLLNIDSSFAPVVIATSAFDEKCKHLSYQSGEETPVNISMSCSSQTSKVIQDPVTMATTAHESPVIEANVSDSESHGSEVCGSLLVKMSCKPITHSVDLLDGNVIVDNGITSLDKSSG